MGANPGRAWWGDMRIDLRNGGVRIAQAPAIDTPAYAAGLDTDDEIKQMQRVQPVPTR